MTIKEHFKKFAAGAVIGAMLIGGGICLAHGHDIPKGENCREQYEQYVAKIQSQAAEKNLTLIDESKVKSIAAKAIGINENELNLRCGLRNFKGKDGNEFKPFYSVHGFKDGIMYALNIDAVSGEVIKDYPREPFHHKGERGQ